MYIHKLDPFALKISESFGIRWYGLSYLAGFFFGFLVIRYAIRRGLSSLQVQEAGDLVFTVALGTIIGGRLGYCFFYSPELLLSFRHDFPFWGVFALNEGGMASHGGILGVVAACFIYARRHGHSALHLCDLCTFGGTIGIFFGRLANFINGELVGRPCGDQCFFPVKFPQDILTWPTYAPERLPSLAPVVEALGQQTSNWNAITSRLAAHWGEIQTTLQNIVLAVQNGNAAVTNALAPLLVARHPSQLIAALLEGAFTFVVLFLVWRKPRKPGVITGIFFVVYALVRIFNEQFRMPDAHLGFQLLGLTRGQWLSIAMLAASVLLLWFWSQRAVPPVEAKRGALNSD